jgi:hypothetical protein
VLPNGLAVIGATGAGLFTTTVDVPHAGLP